MTKDGNGMSSDCPELGHPVGPGSCWRRFADRACYTCLGLVRWRDQEALVFDGPNGPVAIKPSEVLKEFTPT